MKFRPLYDLQQEINRLFIAGSKFAKNDPRLQKHAAIFNNLGEKSPVFKKIAEGIESLLNAESQDSPARLLEVSTLLYAVLYTQGETADPDLQKTEPAPLLSLEHVFTNKSYQALKPLITALTQQGEGRIHDVKTAFKYEPLNDFRVYHLLDAALADRYTELADYIEKTVIPAIGAPVIPYIIKNFNCEGTADDVRRFRILCKLNYPGIPEIVDRILAGKSIPLQTEAVKTLGNNPEHEELLTKFVGDRYKSIRLAAYEALGALKTESAERTLVDLFISGKRKSDIAELGVFLRIKLSDKFVPALFEKAKADYRTCIALDKNADIKITVNAFETFNSSIDTLFNNADRDVMEFYKEVFTNKTYIELALSIRKKMGSCFVSEKIADSAAMNLETAKEGLEYLKFLTEKSPFDEFLYAYFRASVRNKADKKNVFNYFSKHVDKLMERNLFADIFLDGDSKLISNDIDDRWKKLFIDKFAKRKNMYVSFENTRVYIELMGEKSKELQSFLATVVKYSAHMNYSFYTFADLLIDSGHPKAFEIIFDAINSMVKTGFVPDEENPIFSKFPKQYATKFKDAGDKGKAPRVTDACYCIAKIIDGL
jgi:hypothetical protein